MHRANIGFVFLCIDSRTTLTCSAFWSNWVAFNCLQKPEVCLGGACQATSVEYFTHGRSRESNETGFAGIDISHRRAVPMVLRLLNVDRLDSFRDRFQTWAFRLRSSNVLPQSESVLTLNVNHCHPLVSQSTELTSQPKPPLSPFMTIWSGSGPCRLWWRLCSGSSRSQRCVWCGDGELSMQRHCEQSRQCVFPSHSSVDPSPSSSRARCHNETSFRVYSKQTRLLQRSVGWSAKIYHCPISAGTKYRCSFGDRHCVQRSCHFSTSTTTLAATTISYLFQPRPMLSTHVQNTH